MKVTALLPARLESTRIRKKLLKDIKKIPIILHTLNRVKYCKEINEIIVCTDSREIKKKVEKNGFKVILTKKNFSNGTERISSIVDKIKSDLIIDVHADEAILDPKNLTKLVNFHKKNMNFDIIVPHKKNSSSIDENVVKVIFSKNNKVIYFSRAKAPYPFRSKGNFYHHLDIISFKPQALKKFKNFKKGLLEQIEGIELLRAIENKLSIGTFEIDTKTFSINTQEDFKKAQKILSKDKLTKKYIGKIT